MITVRQLAAVMLSLQNQGACNINLVTGTHYAPQIAEAVQIAKSEGLMVPVVWNSSGYELPDALALLAPAVDVFLPDFKYWDPEWASACSQAKDYPKRAAAALAAMKEQQPKDVFAQDGTLSRGVLVRHLVLPTHTRDSKNILRYLAQTYGMEILVSVLRQYVPPRDTDPRMPAELSRRVSAREYESVISFALRLGLSNVFVQRAASASAAYTPYFTSELPAGVLGIPRG